MLSLLTLSENMAVLFFQFSIWKIQVSQNIWIIFKEIYDKWGLSLIGRIKLNLETSKNHMNFSNSFNIN